MPGRTRATACSKARELVSTERRMVASSVGRFHHAQLSIQPGTGCSAAFMGRRDFNDSKTSQVMRRRLVADAAEPQPLNGREDLHDQRAFGDPHLAGGLLRGLNLEARVGEEDGLAGRDQQRRIVAGETGKVTDIRPVPDEQGVELTGSEVAGDGRERAAGSVTVAVPWPEPGRAAASSAAACRISPRRWASSD